MERRSDRHAPRVDDALAHDTNSMTTGSPVEARSDEVREQEGPGEGEPTPGASPAAGPPERRAEIARHLEPSLFPADRDQLVADAESLRAPGEVVALLSRLPERTYRTLEEVWEALGGTPETRR